jgi:hypothetical protein
MLSVSAYRHSPVMAEVGHLSAGISHWRFGRFDLYRVNPPLVRMVAAVPVLAMDPCTDWTNYNLAVVERAESRVGVDFVNANGPRVFWLYTLGRWACIPFSVIGGYFCYRWASELYGAAAGLVACTLWCCCPNISGHGALIMPDVPPAALGLAACYAFWRWLRQPAWRSTFVAGGVLGLAELAKTTLIVFYPLWPILWLIYRWPDRMRMSLCDWGREATMLIAAMLGGLYLINLGHNFEGSFQRLGDYSFRSHMLSGMPAGESISHPAGNRFAGSWLARVPVPVPKDYLRGIDTQRVDFEAKRASYLGGIWSDHGWWYVYLYAAAVKVPLGTWLAGFLAAGTILLGWRSRAEWRDEFQVLIPLLVLGIVVSSHTAFSGCFRYVFPAFPFALVLASRWAADFARPHRKTVCLGAAALAWTITSSLFVYPHSISYFNELAGGPRHGAKYLLESNIDWGQDLLYLKDWLDRHADVKLDGLAYYSSYPARLGGVPETPYPPPGPGSEQVRPRPSGLALDLGPKAGWYALSVNSIRDRSRQFEYFLRFEPAATAGYSIHIYHITPDDANRVRRELGMLETSGWEGQGPKEKGT